MGIRLFLKAIKLMFSHILKATVGDMVTGDNDQAMNLTTWQAMSDPVFQILCLLHLLENIQLTSPYNGIFSY